MTSAADPEPPPSEPGEPRDAAAPAQLPLGQLLLQEGLISSEQLAEALRLQATMERYTAIGQILLNQRVLTRQQLVSALKRHRKQLRLGDILIKAKVLTPERLRGALSHQRKIGLRLGDTLLQLGLVTEAQVRHALCTQLNVPFLDLEHFIPDPSHGLDRLIGRTYARKHRLVPVAKTGDSLTVVMDDPTNEAVVKELEALTGYTITVATSWRASIERAMSKVYGGSPSRSTNPWREPGVRDF